MEERADPVACGESSVCDTVRRTFRDDPWMISTERLIHRNSYGSSRKSGGRKRVAIGLKGAWILDFEAFEKRGDLAWCFDVYFTEAQTSCRRIPIPGFRPLPKLRGVFGDRKARVITLARRSKKRRVRRAEGASLMVRPDDTASAGSVQRRHAHLPRIRGAASRLPKLWSSEARAAVLPHRQHPLHGAVCLLHRPPLSQCHGAGRCQGAAS